MSYSIQASITHSTGTIKLTSTETNGMKQNGSERHYFTLKIDKTKKFKINF